MEEPRLVVVEESKTGMNMRFQDSITGRELNRTEVAKAIDEGQYPDYHHYRNEDGRLVIRSNPDGNMQDNLD